MGPSGTATPALARGVARSLRLRRPGSPPLLAPYSLWCNSRVLHLRTRVASYPAPRSIRKEDFVTQTAVTVNGTRREAEVEPRTLLVYFLREQLGLTGTNVGCDTS